jgi:hypothetical protein
MYRSRKQRTPPPNSSLPDWASPQLSHWPRVVRVAAYAFGPERRQSLRVFAKNLNAPGYGAEQNHLLRTKCTCRLRALILSGGPRLSRSRLLASYTGMPLVAQAAAPGAKAPCNMAGVGPETLFSSPNQFLPLPQRPHAAKPRDMNTCASRAQLSHNEHLQEKGQGGGLPAGRTMAKKWRSASDAEREISLPVAGSESRSRARRAVCAAGGGCGARFCALRIPLRRNSLRMCTYLDVRGKSRRMNTCRKRGGGYPAIGHCIQRRSVVFCRSRWNQSDSNQQSRPGGGTCH